MESKVSEGLKKLLKKTSAEIKSMHNKLRNMKLESFASKLKDLKMKLDINRSYKNINLKPLYNKIRKNKKFTYRAAAGILTLIISVSLISAIVSNINNSRRAYNVMVDEDILAVVRSQEDFLDLLEEVKQEAMSLYGQEIVLSEEPSFVEVKARKAEITEADQIIQNIKSQIDMKLKAVAIKVNGKEVAIVRNEKIASNILEALKAPYLEDESEYDFVGFAENVEVVEVATELADIISEEEALKLISLGTNEEKIHEIEKGENTWTIARKYDLKMDDILKANPDIDPERLQIGQKISLIVPKPLISVQTKEYVELVEEVPFETVYESTEALYKGDKKITVQGEEGKREVKAYIVKENGVEVAREVLEEKILAEPKTRVIAEGTKPRPATMATGAFSNPTRGKLTSKFGMRWGRRHTGIDIAASKGTTVSAADAGKVTFAGRNGAYGNLVIIDHENGYQTYYAHNSKIVVKKGDRVYKGQKIAEMGSTGRSTGVHLHFEVRKNGTPVNPLNFVKY